MRFAAVGLMLAIAPQADAQLSPLAITANIEGRWAPLVETDTGNYTFNCKSEQVLEIELPVTDRVTLFQMREGNGPFRRAKLNAASSNAQGTGSGYLIVSFDDEAHQTFRDLPMFWFVHMQTEDIMMMRRADRADEWSFYQACSKGAPIS